MSVCACLDVRAAGCGALRIGISAVVCGTRWCEDLYILCAQQVCQPQLRLRIVSGHYKRNVRRTYESVGTKLTHTPVPRTGGSISSPVLIEIEKADLDSK